MIHRDGFAFELPGFEIYITGLPGPTSVTEIYIYIYKREGKKNPPNMIAVAACLKMHVYSREITHKLKPILA